MSRGRALRAVTGLLAAATLLSGAAAFHQWQRYQSLQAPAAATPAAQSTEEDAPAGLTALAGTPAAAPTAEAAGPAARAADPAGSRAMNPEQAARHSASIRRELEELRDPASAAAALGRETAMFSQMLRETAPHIGLEPSQIEAAAAAFASASMAARIRRAECALEQSCDIAALHGELENEQRRSAIAQLGAERVERLELYGESVLEQELVVFLRGSGPAGGEVERTNVQTAMALAEERLRFIREAEARGERVEQLPMLSAGSYPLYSAARAGSGSEMTVRMQSATEYAQRQRTRVAGLLTALELAALTEAQDKALARYQRRLAESQVARDAQR